MLIIQEILGYFLIGFIGMVCLAILFLPIYFLLRKRIPLSRQIVFFLLVVCILVISSATFLEWIIACLLGFIFPIAFAKMRKLWSTTICMMLFSFLIEFIQYFVGRSADIDDLMLNTLGGILGYFVFYIFSKLFKDKKLWKKLNGIAL